VFLFDKFRFYPLINVRDIGSFEWLNVVMKIVILVCGFECYFVEKIVGCIHFIDFNI
jgi:hypothetical protein